MCGQHMCSRNETECKKYLKAENAFKAYQKYEQIQSVTLLSHIRYDIGIKLAEHFKQFQSKIKSCSKTVYKWQPNDMCLRAINCFQVIHDRIRFRRQTDPSKKTQPFKSIKNLEPIDCPCPKHKPFACRHQNNKYCSVSKQACNSSGQRVTFVISKDKQIQISVIKKCGNDFDLLG